jgi:hypothetical protein
MGLSRQDEVLDAERVIFGDPLGDLGVAADQRGARARPDQPETGPQVGRDLERVAAW